MDEKEYLIFCDESDRKGKFFSNFYGGVRIGASKLIGVNQRLQTARIKQGLSGEIKWSKTDQNCVERYEQMMRVFFNEISEGNLVVRVMFTKNSNVPQGLTSEQYANEYYLLYYQFLKHGFGLRYMPAHSKPPRLRLYLDEFGDTEEQISKFKGHLSSIGADKHIRKTGLVLHRRDIAHVRSHDHVLMQCLDVVLGSITFRLNDKHLEKPEGATQRGKRTRAKERLYKFIYKEICRVTKKRLNIGITTGLEKFPDDQWLAPYLHWLFKPSSSTHDPSKTKP